MGDIDVKIHTVAGFIRARERTLDSLKERKKLTDASIPQLEKGIEEDKARLAELVKEKEAAKPEEER